MGSALMKAGHFDSSEIKTAVASDFSVVSGPWIYRCKIFSKKAACTCVCDRLNYTLYKIVNNICILYTRMVFPTVKGKSLG